MNQKNNLCYPGTTDKIIEMKTLWYNSQCNRVELELSETLGYEDFPMFAKVICEMLSAKITDESDGPDCRVWKIQTDLNIELLIIYDDFPNRGLITSDNGSHDLFVTNLFETFPGEKKYDYRK